MFDLLTPLRFAVVTAQIVGGLIGQWAVWTQEALALHGEVRAIVKSGGAVPLDLLSLGAELTHANSAIFDPAKNFAGSIDGINEVLAREGLLAGPWCLFGRERLSPGQAEEISQVLAGRARPTARAQANG